NAQREGFELLKPGDLRLQLDDRAGRGGLVEDLLLRGLELVVRRVLDVLDVFRVELGHLVGPGSACEVTATRHDLGLAQLPLEPFAPSPQALVDRLRGAREPALEDREGKADRASSLVV